MPLLDSIPRLIVPIFSVSSAGGGGWGWDNTTPPGPKKEVVYFFTWFLPPLTGSSSTGLFGTCDLADRLITPRLYFKQRSQNKGNARGRSSRRCRCCCCCCCCRAFLEEERKLWRQCHPHHTSHWPQYRGMNPVHSATSQVIQSTGLPDGLFSNQNPNLGKFWNALHWKTLI
jgi:hypothetical protein